MRSAHTLSLLALGAPLFTACSLVVSFEDKVFDAVGGGSTTSSQSSSTTGGGGAGGSTTSSSASDSSTTSTGDTSSTSTGIELGCVGAEDPTKPPPRLARPLNGAYTGSFRSPRPGALKPTFTWKGPEAGSPPECYEIEVQREDAACMSPKSCSFAAPLRKEVSTTSFTPETALEHEAVTIPTGARHYWRVRACRDEVCSSWSAVRYLDVGRTPGDINGDGFADIVAASAVACDSGKISPYVGRFFGSATGPGALVSEKVSTPGFALGNLASSDAQGDGFADLMTGNLDSTKFVDFAPGSELKHAFVAKVPDVQALKFAPVGDVDGDGTREFAISGAGDAKLITTPLFGTFDKIPITTDPAALPIALGDFDGDGLADFGMLRETKLEVFTAGKTDTYAHFAVVMNTTTEQKITDAAWFDLDGDEYSDVVLLVNSNYHLFRGGPSPNFQLEEMPVPFGLPAAPFSVRSVGDFNGDGLRDLAVQHSKGASIVLGGTLQLLAILPEVGIVTGTGDVDGDGFDDVLAAADAFQTCLETPALHFLKGRESGSLGPFKTLTGEGVLGQSSCTPF